MEEEEELKTKQNNELFRAYHAEGTIDRTNARVRMGQPGTPGPKEYGGRLHRWMIHREQY